MTNFDLNNYIEVNVRVEKFWELYPNGRILTEIISFINGIILMKASVYKTLDDNVPDATGHAYEKEGSSFINKTSAIENCETSAVGRALGIMGFEIKKAIASREEVANAVLQQKTDKPKITTAAEADLALKQQLLKKHGGDKEAAKAEYLSNRVKDEPSEEEFNDDISKHIDEVK